MYIKIQHMREFLKARDKVRFTVVFYGREMEHKDLGVLLANRVKTELSDVAALEHDAHEEGNRMILLFAPKRTGKYAEAKNA